MSRTARLFQVSSEMAYERKQNLEKHIGKQIFDGDILHSQFLGYRVWPLTTFSFDIVELPRAVTEKHKNALEHFLSVAEELRRKDIETTIDLAPQDEGLVKRVGNLDSRILNVCVRIDRKPAQDYITFTLASGLNRIIPLGQFLRDSLCLVDIQTWVKKCVTPWQSIVIGHIQTGQSTKRSIKIDFFSDCSYTEWFRNDFSFGQNLPSTMIVGQQDPIDIRKYAAVTRYHSDPSTINAVLQTDLREYCVEVLAISNHERIFQTRRGEKNPEFLYFHEVPSITIWYREMLRHKTIFDVCLALENHGNCNDYTLLWIIKWLPLMDFWSDYKITRVVQGVTKSVKKVRESRELKRITEN